MVNQDDKMDEIDENGDELYNEEDDEIVMDESSEPQDKIKQLQKRLRQTEKEKQEYLSGWQRSKADYINAKKDYSESLASTAQFVKEGLLFELLPIIDSFDMAFANKKSWESADENWRRGVENIHSQLMSVLEANQMKPIMPLGEKFDPHIHTSVELVPVDDPKNDQIILEVIQKGYEISGKVARSPKVKVGDYTKKD
jgi:molecular chaperone GrpE